MDKFILLMLLGTTFLLVSCTTPVRTKSTKNTVIEKKYKCILRMVEQNGIEPEIAEKVCDKVYIKRSRNEKSNN